MSDSDDFDIQAAWLRRFHADAESNLKAFALRLKEAMPELVTVRESKGLFRAQRGITGVSVELGDKPVHAGNRPRPAEGDRRDGGARHHAEHEDRRSGRLVRPAGAKKPRHATDHARSLSRSLTSFMES